ncbi:hypothetical protein D9M68_755950 [compost metagenome]
MRQAGIAAIFVPAEEINAGCQKIDGRLGKELIAAAGAVTFFHGLDQSLRCFRSVGKGVEVLPLPGVHPFAFFRFVQIDYMEFIIKAFTILFGQ